MNKARAKELGEIAAKQKLQSSPFKHSAFYIESRGSNKMCDLIVAWKQGYKDVRNY